MNNATPAKVPWFIGDAPKKSAIVPCVRDNTSDPPPIAIASVVESCDNIALSLKACISSIFKVTPLSEAAVKAAKVAGEPVDSAGIRATAGLKKSRSSSAREFRLASASTRIRGISSPELHSSSIG